MGDLDFFMAPVLSNLIKYESLKDGTLTYCDILILNDALRVQNENISRIKDNHK